MSDTVIRVENLSKKYIIRHQQAQQYTALRDVIADGVKSLGRRLTGEMQDSSLGSTKEEFWALKDVSFEVKQGDRVGIIGRNGAGKSTLLKILSRIVEPTKGEITLNGRVASLLEVGTGFHPELTGRENIYLNGAILGMSRIEIKKKFDEIVNFAEVEKFLDTPVKHYSSGMYVRLAFAVAAHLEPDILVVDEVLAVGDAQFQRKCLGKMEDVAEDGRTILFVSHNTIAVKTLCSKAYLLNEGMLVHQGMPTEVTNFYAKLTQIDSKNEIHHITSSKITWLGIANRSSLNELLANEDINFHLEFMSGEDNLENIYIDCEIFNEKEENVIHTKSKYINNGFNILPRSRFSLNYLIKSPKLIPGNYYLMIYIYSSYETLLWVEKIDALTISTKSYFSQHSFFDKLNAAIIPDFTIEVNYDHTYILPSRNS